MQQADGVGPMRRLSELAITRRRLAVVVWIVLAVAGAVLAPRVIDALTFDFGLPGQPGHETNERIAGDFGSGGDRAPVLLLVRAGHSPLTDRQASRIEQAVAEAAPGSRVASWRESSALRSADGRVGIVLVHPRRPASADEPPAALPALIRLAARRADADRAVRVSVTGVDALASGGAGGGADVIAETLLGAVGAVLVLVVVFGSVLAVAPLIVAAVSILTTFLLVYVLTLVTDVSGVVQFLLALIGLGVAIDYSLLIVTRWREERSHGTDNLDAVRAAMTTAGRAVLFSGLTVAVSLASLIVLPVPYLRSVGYAGLLIPLVSVATALTLLPALLAMAGERLEWPHRRTASRPSRMWHRIGALVVRRRWTSALAATVVLLALAAPVVSVRLSDPSNAALAAGHPGPAASAVTALDDSGIGAGLTRPVEVLTKDPAATTAALAHVRGVAGVTAPATWRKDGRAVVDAWTASDPATADGADTLARIRAAAAQTDARAGGVSAQTDDFVHAVYDNAWWLLLLVAALTALLLGRALRSVVLPLKALVLNVLSVAAAYGVTTLIWQHGIGTHALFGEPAASAITVWVPVATFAFLFGLSMDYEVFLLARIREEHAAGADTATATVRGVARTGRLVTSAALILFFAFVALSRTPDNDVKILATALALGITVDATVVRGVLAPALVAALGKANWWLPGRRGRADVLSLHK